VVGKSVEFWVAIAVGVLIVLHRNADKSRLTRITLAAISGGLAFSFAPEFAEWTGRSENLAAVVISAFGYMIFDIAAAVLSDRDFIKSVIMRWAGK